MTQTIPLNNVTGAIFQDSDDKITHEPLSISYKPSTAAVKPPELSRDDSSVIASGKRNIVIPCRHIR